MAEIKIDPVIGPRLLETITSALYEDTIIIFREYVQNSVDAYNMAIDMDQSDEFDGFFVDIRLDRKNSSIEILDNGYGIPEKEFLTKMTTIGSSEKGKFKDQIGFRGIGRLSAMPLCKCLTFINKPKGLNELQYFTWDGDKFHELLNQGEEPDFRATIEKIANISNEKYLGDVDDHFFKVEIQGYKEEISELLKGDDFKDRLCVMLPLQYSTEFTNQEKIKAKYKNFMGQSLDKFSFTVKLDGEELYKPYTDKDILESGIVFWELKYPSKKRGIPGEKIGILWFSFNKLITARKKDEPYGILVRSKNMLMGTQYSLSNAIIRSKSDYVTTPRELTQTLDGVTGEMLIHTTRLNDNARRDWFRIDEESIPLRHIIVDFMRRLHAYRYAASGFFRDKTNKEKLIKAYTDLTNFDSEKFSEKLVSDINKIKEEINANKEVFKFADEDIPVFPITIKRFYERLIKCLYDYFSINKRLEEFIKIRTLIKKDLNKEQKS